MPDKTNKMTCAQLWLRSAWACTQCDQSSLCAHWVAKDSMCLHADSEDMQYLSEHDILDGAHNWGHKQTNLIIRVFAKAFDKVPHQRVLWLMVSKMISSSDPLLGYLGHSGWTQNVSSMVFVQTLPLCCLVSPRPALKICLFAIFKLGW